MKSKIIRKVTSYVLSGAIALSSVTFLSNSVVQAGLGYWPDDLPISNEYYHENETLQPYGACFLIDELKNWTPDNDPDARYNRGGIPLQERWMGPNVNPNASRDAKVMPLAVTNARASQAPSQGGDGVYSYAFTNFQYVDNYNFWGGSSAEGPIAIPSPEHIDAAHKNGVKATGTIFIPWGDYEYGGRLITELVEKKADGSFPAADKLIEIAQYYGFDGYIINQESSSTTESMAKFKEMLQYIQLKKPENFTMNWYNGSGSLNDSAVTSWLQDGDKKINDDWWLDMSWSGIDSTIKAAKDAGRSPFDIHASWENFPYTDKGGAVSNLIGKDNKLKTSLGILGPVATLISSKNIEQFMNKKDIELWTGPTKDPRNTERLEGKTKWCGFSSLIADQTPIIGDEFATNFTAGNGYKFYENGVVTGKENGWYNRSIMDVMPTWRWIVDSEGSKLTPIIDYADAWFGGTSLKVSGNLDANKANTIMLYSTQLDIKDSSKLSITYKTPKAGAEMSVGLCFGDTYAEKNFKYYPVAVTADAKWSTATIDLGADAGKKAIAISLKYNADSNLTDYSMNVGRLAITSNDTAPQDIDSITLDEYIYINDTTAEARAYWDKADGADYYMIHRVKADDSREFIGSTPNNAFYLGKFVKDGDETDFDFEVTPYKANGAKGAAKTLNFKWPTATNEFEDGGIEGDNIALRAPVVSDGTFDPGGAIDKLNDGVIPNSKWCSSKTDASAYLDLGKEYDISRWVVKHANTPGAGEGADFNTDSFDLQYAADDSQPLLDSENEISANRVMGLTYTKADQVTGNRQDVTDRMLENPIKARYIKLHVTKSDNCPWHAIRIYEFELYENAIDLHSSALLERNVTVKNNDGAKDTAVFNNVAMPIAGGGAVAANTGIVKIYDSLTAETPIAETKATQPSELYKQRRRGVASFENINLKPEGGRLYYTTQQNGLDSLRYSVEYAPETGTAIKSPTVKLEHSLKGNQTRSKYGVFTLEGLEVGTTMKVYESADSKSPILHSRPVQDGEDFIRQERVPLAKDGGKIYYELKQSGRPDTARLEYTYGPTDELSVDQDSIKDFAYKYNNLKESKYTPDTWSAFKTALADVKSLVGIDTKAADAEVKRDTLEKSAAELRVVPDVTRLTEVCAEYEAMYKQEIYSVKSFTRFTTALNATKDFINKAQTTPCTKSELEKTRIALDDSVQRLVVKADEKVNSVTVSPVDIDLLPNGTATFKPTVSVEGEADDTVTWELSGKTSANTTLVDGVLTVGADETIGSNLTIKAISTFDITKTAEAKVLVVDKIVPKVTSVTITDKVESIERGKSKQLNADVVVKNNADTSVVWTIDNANSDKTVINNGLIFVDIAEASNQITVKATSVVDPTKVATKVIAIVNTPPTILSVAVSPSNIRVIKGNTQQFTATVKAEGGADQSVTWSVSYNESTDTKIDENGLLTMGADETASDICVIAKSKFNQQKRAYVYIYPTSGYTVTFANTDLASVKVETDKTVTKPADPTKAGYTFNGWFAEAEFTNAFNFDTAITANTTIYAKFTKNAIIPNPPTGGGSTSTNTPVDVTVTDTNKTGVSVEVPKEITNITNPSLNVAELPNWSATSKEFAKAANKFDILKTFMIDLYDGSSKVTQVEGGKVKVEMPFAGANGKEYVVLRYNDNKTVTELKATYKDGKITFETDHFSVYAIAVKADSKPVIKPIIKPVIKPVKPTTPPRTSDTTPVYAGLVLALLAGAVMVTRKKLCK